MNDANDGSREAEALARLMQQTADGDRKAFGRLYARTSPKLFSLLLRILKQEPVAEEVLQDVYVRVWQKAGSYDPGRARVSTWLATIARNRALDRIRGRRDEVVTGLELSEFADESGRGPSLEAQNLDTARALSICLEELEAEQRRSILMAFYEGMTHGELAGAMSRPLGTIKTWIRRGLARLRDCLDRGSHHETA